MNEDQAREFLSGSSQEYCCYCLTERYGMSCCGENHFIEFKDMYPEDQAMFIAEMMGEE